MRIHAGNGPAHELLVHRGVFQFLDLEDGLVAEPRAAEFQLPELIGNLRVK